jgi:hypothetical protein
MRSIAERPPVWEDKRARSDGSIVTDGSLRPPDTDISRPADRRRLAAHEYERPIRLRVRPVARQGIGLVDDHYVATDAWRITAPPGSRHHRDAVLPSALRALPSQGCSCSLSHEPESGTVGSQLPDSDCRPLGHLYPGALGDLWKRARTVFILRGGPAANVLGLRYHGQRNSIERRPGPSSRRPKRSVLGFSAAWSPYRPYGCSHGSLLG